MSTLVPMDGTQLSYSGVTFTVYKSNIRSNPVPDAANRTTVFVEHNIHVEAFILATPGGDTEATMASLKQQLTVCGQRLTVKKKGWGSIDVNAGAGALRDVAFGPVPKILTWEPVGNNLAAKVTFEVVTRLPECPAATYQRGILEFNFSESYALDENGLCTISRKGHLIIPMTRNGDRSLPDHVDKYRELTQPTLPLRFKPQRQTFEVSLDKRRIDFHYSYHEMPVLLPQGSTACQVTHEVHSTLRPAGYVTWQCSLTMDITLAPDHERDQAWVAFLMVVNRRLHASGNRFSVRPGIGNALPAGQQPSSSGHRRRMLMTSLRVTEHPYGLNHSFNMAYTLILQDERDGLRHIFTDSGLWRILPQQTRPAQINYRRTLGNTAYHVRGFAKLAGRPTDESIIDLCVQRRPVQTPSIQEQLLTPAGGTGGGVAGVQDHGHNAHDMRDEGDVDDDVDTSFLAYTLDLQYVEDGGRYARHKPMGGRTVTQTGLDAANATADQFRDQKGGIVGTARTDTPDVLQEASSPSGRLVLTGAATRIGYDIPLPDLLQVGNQRPVKNREWSKSRTLTTWEGQRIIQTVWSIEYLLPSPPTTPLPDLANPMMGLGGGGSSSGSGVQLATPLGGELT